MSATGKPGAGAGMPDDGAPPAGDAPRRPVVLRYVDDWDELAGQIAADRAVGLTSSPVRRALTMWFDPGSFTETGILARRAATSYRGGDTLDDAMPATVPADGLVAGWGRYHGQLVFVAGDDPTLGSPVRGGAGAAKANRMRQHALTQRAPIVQILGADRVEPDTFIGAEFVRFGYGLDLDFEEQSADRILKIAIVTHPIAGQAALEAGWCQFVILAGPEAAVEGLAGREAVAAGLVDAVRDDLDGALALAGELLDRLPPSSYARAAGPDGPAPGPAGGWNFEIRPGRPVGAWLATLGPRGRVVGWLELGGVLAADKLAAAAHLARFCRAFGLPLVVQHDGWSHPTRPNRRDVDEHRRLGSILRGCPVLIEAAAAPFRIERSWGVRPTVTMATVASDGTEAPPVEADLVVDRGRVTDAVDDVVASLEIERPAPHDDPRVHRRRARPLSSD